MNETNILTERINIFKYFSLGFFLFVLLVSSTNSVKATQFSLSTQSITNPSEFFLPSNVKIIFEKKLLSNELPTDIDLSNNSVAENQSPGSLVGALSTTDPDSGDIFTYTLTDTLNYPDNDSFQIGGVSSDQLLTAESFNYEAQNSYSIRIRTDDGQGGVFDEVFTITVTDVNEAPEVALDNETITLAEDTNTTNPIKVADIIVTDDGMGTYTLSLSGSDAALFEIDGSELQLIAGATLDYETNPTLNVTVAIDDNTVGSTPDDTGDLAITITNANDAPTDIDLSNNSVAENQSSGSLVGALSTTDPDSGDFFTYTLTDTLNYPDNDSFQIGGVSYDQLLTAESFNFETQNSYSIKIRTDDGQGGVFDKVFTITVTDVNEAPEVALDNEIITLAEDTNTTNPIKVADIIVTDDGMGTYTLSLSGSDAALFDINGSELRLKAGTTLDYETNPTLNVTVMVDDNTVGSTPDDTADLAITVTNVNEAPEVALDNETITLAEDTNTTSPIKVADIIVTDDGMGINTLSLSGSDAALFEINGSELRLKAGTTLDYETNPTLNVTVMVDDNTVGSTPDDTADLAITITNANEAPTDIDLSNNSVAENQSSGSLVGALSTTDPDSGDIFTYTLTDTLNYPDNVSFQIGGVSSDQLLTAESFNYEAQNSYSIRIRTDDGQGGVFDKAFTINVTDVNEAPEVALDNVTITLAEDTNTTNPIKVADIIVTDDGMGTYTLSLSGSDAALFEINGNELRLKAGTTLDYEGNPTLNLTVAVDDNTVGSTPDDTADLAITITDANEAPTDIDLSNNSVAENQSLGSLVGTLSTTDPDSGDIFTYTLTDTLNYPDNNAFLIGGASTDELQSAVSFNFETKNSYSIRILTDDGQDGTFDKTFTITVTDVNESPTIALLNMTTMLAEDTNTTNPIKVADILVTDDALGDNSLSLSGSDAALFEIDGGELRLKAGTTLDYEANPTLNVTVVIDDNTVGSTPDDTADLEITINNMNESPTDINISNNNVAENQIPGTLVGTLSTIDPEVGDIFTYTLDDTSSYPDNNAFQIGGELSNQLQSAVSFNFETQNSYTINIRTDDGQGGLFTKVFTITVIDINEAPIVALANEIITLAEDTNTTSPIKVADIVVTDDGMGTYTLSLSGSDAALFEIDGSELRLKAGTTLDYETNPTLNITVAIDDNTVGSTPDDTADLAITISDANEAPTDIDLSNNSVAENQSPGTLVGALSTTDPDTGDTFTYTFTDTLNYPDNDSFQIGGVSSKELQTGMSFDFETKYSYLVKIQSEDSSGATYAEVFTISVENLSEYSLNVNKFGFGEVIKNPDKTIYDYGDIVELSTSTPVGWEFTGWSGDLIHIDNPVDIVMNGNKIVTAHFLQAVQTWYFAEGYTSVDFTTYIHIKNLVNEATKVNITFMLEGGGIKTNTLNLLPNGSTTINANDIVPNEAFSTMLVSDNPICVERTVYWSNGVETVGGHSSSGVTSPSTSWYFPNGSTQDDYQTYILLQNPNDSTAHANVIYTLDNNAIYTRTHTLPAHSRYTIYTNDPNQVGSDQGFSTKIFTDQPVIAEKTIYFMNEGNNTFGSTAPATTWYMPEGNTINSAETNIFIQNPNSQTASVDLTYMIEGGGTKVKTFNILPNKRLIIYTRDSDQMSSGKVFSVRLISTIPVIAERSIYWSNGPGNIAGHDTIGSTISANTWFFANDDVPEEVENFNIYLLIQNPNTISETVTVEYSLLNGTTITKSYLIPPESRYSISTNNSEEIGPDTTFSARLVSDFPFIVERSMYYANGGDCSMGIPESAVNLYFMPITLK